MLRRSLLPAARLIRLAIAAIAALVAIVAADPLSAASPQFNRIVPTGGQRGTEVEVQLIGARLGDAPQLLFYEPGLSVTSVQTVDANNAKAKIAIAPDSRLGLHGMRIRTASGLSNLRLLSVGTLPEASEVEPNSDFAQPQKIALDTTVNGIMQNEDVDYYLVEAKKGERITAEIEAIRHGFGISAVFFDPYVAIMDMGRFELARNDDSSLLKQDSTVSVIAAADGTYVVQVRDGSYASGDTRRVSLACRSLSQAHCHPAWRRAAR